VSQSCKPKKQGVGHQPSVQKSNELLHEPHFPPRSFLQITACPTLNLNIHHEIPCPYSCPRGLYCCDTHLDTLLPLDARQLLSSFNWRSCTSLNCPSSRTLLNIGVNRCTSLLGASTGLATERGVRPRVSGFVGRRFKSERGKSGVKPSYQLPGST
jgi:hypothetical protein